MRRNSRRGIVALGLGCCLLVAACAPRLQDIGPAVDAPRLTADAIHTADGIDLPLRSWLPWKGPAQAVILALHGFNDYSKGMAIPGKGLARRGFAVFAYDQRGFGETPERGVWAGSDRMIADLKTATLLLRRAYPGLPVYWLGESMGAAVMMAAAVGPDPVPVDGMILAAPAVWGWQTQSAFNRAVLDEAAHLVPWMTVVPTGLRLQASSNRRALIDLGRDDLVIHRTRVDAAYGLVDLMTRAYDAMPELRTPRHLLLYGGEEAILNTGAVALSQKQLPKLPPEIQRIARYPRGYHLILRDLDAPRVFDDIASWIRDPAAPLPSGADLVPAAAAD